MRAKELILEDYNQSLQSDLENLLVNVKAAGVTQVPTAKLADQLNNSGYSVSPSSLMMLLQDNPMVMNVTPEMVELTAPEAGGTGGQTQDSASQVSDMAQSATKIG